VWCAVSNNCVADNGVKLGVLFFCVYEDDLGYLLFKTGVGCYIGSNCVGPLAYADDIVLIAPTDTASRNLLIICDE